MKFGIALAIIVHYTVQFNLECCKSSVSNMGPNTFFKIKKIIIRRLKSEIRKISNIPDPYEIWYSICYNSLCIIYTRTIQFGVLLKALYRTWALILFGIIQLKIDTLS